MSAEAFGDVRREELLIHVICGLLDGCRHVAVGTMSPIPGSGALLAREKRGMRVTVLGSDLPEHRSDGGMELFDMAGQGRMDAFFLSGGQIDGQANINLHGAGAYPNMKVRWSGAFGSAYLYFEVPRVILFREEHSPRVFVEQVDFISAPGVSPPGVRRRGGPHALVTELCLMMFDRERARFSLASLHPGVTLEEVRDRTGFDFDAPEEPPTTGLPDVETLALIRGPVAHKIAEAYPEFGRAVFGVEAAA